MNSRPVYCIYTMNILSSRKLVAPAIVVLSLVLTTLHGCAQTATPSNSTVQATAALALPSQWAKPINTQFNLYQVDELLYRSQQPETHNVEELRALGIRTVISFRALHSDDQIIQDPEIMLVRIPIHTSYIRDKDVIAALNAIEQARQRGPVLIHCMHGADRTGLLSAMYRVVYQGWSKEAALDEMKNGGFGFHSMWTNITQYLEEVNIDEIKLQLHF